MTISAQSISTYISNLEKDNAALRERVKDLEETRDSLMQDIVDENAKRWDEYLVEDDESVASNPDESESDSEYEPDEYKPFSDSDSETESESDSDSDYTIRYNYALAALFDDLAVKEKDKYKKVAFKRAADLVYDYPSRIKCGEQIAHISGIGPGIVRRIDEFLGMDTDDESTSASWFAESK